MVNKFIKDDAGFDQWDTYEIATRVGYGDYKTLSKYFRRYTHMSLSAYRRRLRLK